MGSTNLIKPKFLCQIKVKVKSFVMLSRTVVFSVALLLLVLTTSCAGARRNKKERLPKKVAKWRRDNGELRDLTKVPSGVRRKVDKEDRLLSRVNPVRQSNSNQRRGSRPSLKALNKLF